MSDTHFSFRKQTENKLLLNVRFSYSHALVGTNKQKQNASKSFKSSLAQMFLHEDNISGNHILPSKEQRHNS